MKRTLRKLKTLTSKIKESESIISNMESWSMKTHKDLRSIEDEKEGLINMKNDKISLLNKLILDVEAEKVKLLATIPDEA